MVEDTMKKMSLTLRGKSRRGAPSLFDRCELDADVELPVNARATPVNASSKAYQAGYAAGAAAAADDGPESAFSTLDAGKAGDALLNAVGLDEAARILGVKNPFDDGSPRRTTREFQVACDEYNVGYAIGWSAGEAAALEQVGVRF